MPFVLGLGGTVVRGKMDLLVEIERRTARRRLQDRRARAAPTLRELAERYATQRDLYALAARGRRGATPTASRCRAAHCFLEAPDRAVVHTYDAAGLDEARRRLEGLIDGISAGDFARTDHPHPRSATAARRRRACAASRPGGHRAGGRECSGARLSAVRVRLAIFAYGSLVSLASAERTLGRPVRPPRAWPAWPAGGGAGRWCATTSAPRRPSPGPTTGTVPPYCVGLNLERAAGATGPNGVLIEVTEAELDRLALRELRYDAVDVTGEVAGAEGPAPWTA